MGTCFLWVGVVVGCMHSPFSGGGSLHLWVFVLHLWGIVIRQFVWSHGEPPVVES